MLFNKQGMVHIPSTWRIIPRLVFVVTIVSEFIHGISH